MKDNSKKGSKIRMIIGGMICILVILGAINFFLVRREALERFASYQEKAKTIETTYGRLSYIDEGEGEVILSVHGICGGYDQAYDTLADKKEGYRILAPSRFGYPGSDMPQNPSIEKQVEAFVELLDQLQIDQTYIIATSAGGTSAIKFSLMYPERVKGLILYCSGYPALEKPEKEVTMAGPPAFFCNDLVMWMISPLFKPIMGLDGSTLKQIMPFGDKKDGIVFDGTVTNTDMINHYQEYDMSKLCVPVLIVHAKDDKLAKYEGVAALAEKIPDCTFVSLESGGHLMEGNEKVIEDAWNSFFTSK